MTSDWPSDLTSTFNLVHSRFALPDAGTHSPRSVVSRLAALVKPGGYIQQSEMVFTPWPSNGPAMKQFQQAYINLFTIVIGGQELKHLYNIEKWYHEMGLEDVQYEISTIPIGAKAESERIRVISIEIFGLTC
ncbi:putative umta methyltransferase family protein [Botrytis fragariae]|uniref:Putative umta methyltransferase family protein n=1 Tax=Botrytis fragariae TaxID=1964551 RepID=A0A8H6EPH0_9HELO|nr:putative umta methyltransferase family protein [Botrytis fragariae]KAF5879420.1 putative umta methyltransferase family protein [Botrytis fragariae]